MQRSDAMVNNTALPPLPSVRAKDLESRSSTLSQRHAPIDAQNKNTVVENNQCNQAEICVEKKCNFRQEENNIESGREASITAIEQRYRERLEQIDLLHQKEKKIFDQLPPLDPSLICNAIHQYLSSTTPFLNTYIADANASLEGTSHKLSVLENQMSLLESTLESLPWLFAEQSSQKDSPRKNYK